MCKVKICGLSRTEDIEAVNRALPDYVGFVFAPGRRRVDAETARALKAGLDPRIRAVGVFVNEDAETVADIYRKGIIELAQLHGDEDDAYIRRLKILCGCAIIKAVGAGGAQPADVRSHAAHQAAAVRNAKSPEAAAIRYAQPLQSTTLRNAQSPASATHMFTALTAGTDFLLFDASTVLRGGAGVKFDWNLLKDYNGPPYFLAGGLDAQNVREALATLNPYCLDVSSGVETGGLKDAGKIDEFIRKARMPGK